MSLDCIAITNHNTFDRKQFENISKCVNAKDYSGMEIEYLPLGATISNRLNVFLGTRTFWKTYNKEKIKYTFKDKHEIM